MKTMELTPAEVALIEDYRRKNVEKEAFKRALVCAAYKVCSWALEGAGGAGVLDERSFNLANSILKNDFDAGELPPAGIFYRNGQISQLP